MEKTKESGGYARLCGFLRSNSISFFTQCIFVNHLLCVGHCSGPEDNGKKQRNMALLS